MFAHMVPLQSSRSISVNVDMKRVCIFRILQCYIDLTCHALVSLSHRSSALADMDFMDPITGNEHQSLKDIQSTGSWQVVNLYLAVLAVEPQHTDLPCTRHSIGKRGIHRCVGLEGFG